MTYPKWKIKSQHDSKIEIIDYNPFEEIQTRKIWRLETELDNDISKLLDDNGIEHMRYISDKSNKFVYWIYNKEDHQIAKFLI